MIDVNTLTAILPLLRSSGVSRFKTEGFEIDFHGPSIPLTAEVNRSEALASLTETKVDAKESEAATALINNQLPVDLRTDNINKFDTILNWSAGPDLDEPKNDGETMQATADVPMTGQN